MNGQSILICLTVLILGLVSCRKNYIEEYPEFKGQWKSSNAYLYIEADGLVNYAERNAEIPGSFRHVIEGDIKIKEDQLTIKAWKSKTFRINQEPSQVRVGKDLYNTYMILNRDSFFKRPIHDVDYSYFCSNGKKDWKEGGIDCGGECEPCKTCNDGIMNQDETGIDCGGVCTKCPTSPCDSLLTFFEGIVYRCADGQDENSLVYVPIYSFTDTSFGYVELRRFSLDWGGAHTTIRFAYDSGKPLPHGEYQLTSNFENIENEERGMASIKYSNPLYSDIISTKGFLYLSDYNGKTVVTWCNVKCSSEFYPCMDASGRLFW